MQYLARSTIALATMLAALAGTAQAAVQTYTFTATVNPAYQGTDLTGANADVTGSFSFDDAAPATSGPYPQGSAWYGALQSFSFNVASLHGSLTTPGGSDSVLIRNNFDATGPAPYSDAFSIQTQPMSGNARQGYEIHNAYVYLNDASATALGSTALPTAPINLAAFDTRLLHVQYGAGSEREFYATLTSVTAVPEPEQAALLLAGLGALGLMARRQHRAAQG